MGAGRSVPGPVSHTYTQQGTYTATLTVSDDQTEERTASVQIVVGPTPRPRAGSAPQGGVQGELRTRPSIRTPSSQKVRSVIRRGLRLRVSCDADLPREVRAADLRRAGRGLEAVAVFRRRWLTHDRGRSSSRNVRRNLIAAMRQAGMKKVTVTAITTVTTDEVSRAFPVRVTLRR